MLSVGANVAVSVEEPAPATVTVDPEIVATDVVPEEYVHEPATAEPPNVAVGAVNEKAASPNDLFGDGTLNAPSSGAALSTISVWLSDPVLYLPVSVGVNVAVILEVPRPTMVTRFPDTVATEFVADTYDHEPATSVAPNFAVGFTRSNAASPYVFRPIEKSPRDTVTRSITKMRTTSVAAE